MSKVVDITGMRFGNLTVIERKGSNANGRAMWLYRCVCGREKITIGKDIRQGKIVGCGYHKLGGLKHGLKRTPEYSAWQSMKARCTYPYEHNTKYYISRNIKVCDRWLNSFENFLADMGSRPSKLHSIDRINNDGNYEPGNCRWATAHEQRMNQRRMYAREN